MAKLLDDEHLEFSNYDQLGYKDYGIAYVEVFVDDVHVGDSTIWEDSEQDGREYITLNYEVVYLDTIRQLN